MEYPLNKSLISSTNLTNWIVRVITRYREESVMGDIKALFQQVLVPEKGKTLSSLFWWEDHNINNNVADFEMGVHVFGGTSSPSCCNYAFKKTALDNAEKYQKEVTDTLRRNSYADDLLKSVRDVNTEKIQMRIAGDVLKPKRSSRL